MKLSRIMKLYNISLRVWVPAFIKTHWTMYLRFVHFTIMWTTPQLKVKKKTKKIKSENILRFSSKTHNLTLLSFNSYYVTT